MSSMVTIEFLFNFISRYKLAVMSSVTTNNTSESALVGIAATEDLKIIFDTVTDSRKYQNLLQNPSISFVIGWEEERTVQYEGVARIPVGNELAELKKIYFSVFPEGVEREQGKNIVYFCVEPKWIRYSDFDLPQRIEEMKF